MPKKLEKLDAVITLVTGEPLRHVSGDPDAPLVRDMTIRMGLLVEIASFKADVLESIQLDDLAVKLYKAGEGVELTDGEIGLLRKVLKANPANYLSRALAQLARVVGTD